jgi:hypothetical protein
MRCEQINNTGLQLLRPRSACEDPTNRHREVLFSSEEGGRRWRTVRRSWPPCSLQHACARPGSQVSNSVRIHLAPRSASRKLQHHRASNYPSCLTFLVRYIAAATKMCYPPRRCVYDGLLMAFITQLDPSCKGFIYNTLTACAIEPPSGEENNPTTPPHLAASEACFVEGFWIKFGPQPPLEDTKFILTGSIITNLKNIVRAISVERFPVLLQGPTSAGVLSSRLTVFSRLFTDVFTQEKRLS